jgi:hypothetical protein
MGLVFWDVQVGHVAGMRAVGCLHAMLVARGIEMRTCAGEGRLALADGVDVESMFARRQAFHRELQQDAVRRLPKLDLADILATCVLQRRHGGLCLS